MTKPGEYAEKYSTMHAQNDPGGLARWRTCRGNTLESAVVSVFQGKATPEQAELVRVWEERLIMEWVADGSMEVDTPTLSRQARIAWSRRERSGE